jgi:uncharacterized protein YndB with AHSA1/START domain
MPTQEKTVLTVQSTINGPIEKVWESWNNPEDITNWCSPSPDWHTPTATNDLREGGRFSSRMEAKDGSMGFDFGGKYTTVKKNESIEYTIDDDRKVKITFTPDGDTTKVVEQFEAESINPIEMQQGGWQAILDNFKKYTEAK